VGQADPLPSGRLRVKVILKIVGVTLIAFGCAWFLPGIGVLPGSFMCPLLVVARRRGRLSLAGERPWPEAHGRVFLSRYGSMWTSVWTDAYPRMIGCL